MSGEVNELLDEHLAKVVHWQSEDISTPIYVECDKMYRSKVCVQEFSYFVSGLDIQLEKSEYDSPVRQKIRSRWRNVTSHIPFFPSNQFEPMAKWLRLVAESRATWVRLMMNAETLCCASAILRGTEPVSALTRALFILLRSV